MCGFFSAFTGVMRPELGWTAALGAMGLPRAVSWRGREEEELVCVLVSTVWWTPCIPRHYTRARHQETFYCVHVLRHNTTDHTPGRRANNSVLD